MGTVGTGTLANATCIGNNTSVTIAADGTALVLWMDGTNAKFSYASSPYTSWTTATMNSGTKGVMSALLDVSDNVYAVTASTAGAPNYGPFTKSGATYTLGSFTSLGASAVAAAQPLMVAKDGQGRYWMVENIAAGTAAKAYYSTTPATPTWTNSLNATATADSRMPAADIAGNFLVVLFSSAATTFQYQRLDISGALGSWSTATTIAVLGGTPGNADFWCFRGNATIGVLVYTSGSGIYANTYTAGTDTWNAAVQLSSNALDTAPTLVKVGTTFYALWCQNIAANNYALVYKKFDGSAWDSSPTTLVASGTNISNVNAGYGNGTVGALYTVGTANPWTVSFVTFTAPLALSATLAGAGTLAGTLTAQTALAVTMDGIGALAGTLTLSTALAGTLAGVGTLASIFSLRTALMTTLSGVGTLAGTLSITGAVSFTGTLSGVGTLAGTLSIPGTSYLSALWVTRDLAATWKTRDDKAAWDTRDDQAKWKTRG